MHKTIINLVPIVISKLNLYNVPLIFIFVSLVTFFNTIYIAQLFLLTPLLFAIYWIVSIFVFIFKRYTYATYTVVIQRYWKRTLYLFWSIELFLFAIYVFLILNTPIEVEWLLDQSQQFLNFSFLINDLVVDLVRVLAAILLIYIGSILLTNNYTSMLVIMGFILFLSCQFFFSDFKTMFYLSSYYTHGKWALNLDTRVWDLSSGNIRARTEYHYVWLVAVLKFWHTMFIVGGILVSTMFLTQNNSIWQGQLAFNKQNLFFLFGFVLLTGWQGLKLYMQVIWEPTYQWYFINQYAAHSINGYALVKSLVW